MRHFERRELQRATGVDPFPYFKLATWDGLALCFRDGRRTYPTLAQARADARKPGRYRISEISDGGRSDLVPFEV